ncbi:hypothetical protein D3C72_2310920 [compost metagenome]
MLRGEVQRHGQLQHVPGPLSLQAQLDAGGEIIRLLGGEQRWAKQPQAGQQGQAGAAQVSPVDHALTRSSSGSARLGGKGAK